MNIVEYIGREGVVTTPSALLASRITRPTPGDVVDFGLVQGKYPFKDRYGTIEGKGTGMAKDDEYHLCTHMGSIYLSIHERNKPVVSISGGPWACVHRSRLVWPSIFSEGTQALAKANGIEFDQFRMQRMWNWGDLGAGAGHAVEYYIMRPVFVLLPES